MSSCCWGSEGVWGGYPPPAIAGRTCCGGSGRGTPPDQLLADAAVGVRGGVPPLNQELAGAYNLGKLANCRGLEERGNPRPRALGPGLLDRGMQLAPKGHPLPPILGLTQPSNYLTLKGSFSAVSKPNFARKYALESSRRDLHNALLCNVLESNPKKRGKP